MKRALVIAAAAGARTVDCTILGGPTITATCASTVPAAGAVVFVDELGPGSWVCLSGGPLGVAAQNANNADSIAAAGTTNFLGALPFTAVAGRRYKVTISWGGVIQVGTGQSEVQIWRDLGAGAVQQVEAIAFVGAAGAGVTVAGSTLVWTDVPGAATATYSLRGFTSATTIQLKQQYEILVEDIGPA